MRTVWTFLGMMSPRFKSDELLSNIPRSEAISRRHPLPLERYWGIAIAASLSLLLMPQTAVAADLAVVDDSPPSVLAMSGLDHSQHTLKMYRGRVVVINFWTTWCPPCVRELPSLERLTDSMSVDKLVVLAVNVAEPRDRVRRFRRLPRPPLKVLLDEKGQHAEQWGVTVYPTSYVLAPDGEVAFRVIGEADWEGTELRQKIEALLPQNPLK